jgi:hypothetical protein
VCSICRREAQTNVSSIDIQSQISRKAVSSANHPQVHHQLINIYGAQLLCSRVDAPWPCSVAAGAICARHGTARTGDAVCKQSAPLLVARACVHAGQTGGRHEHVTAATELYGRFEVFTLVTMKNVVFWDLETQFVPRRRHITSPLQSPAS